MKGKLIRREIFASLPAIDGRLADMTQKERDDYVKTLFDNTKEVMSHGILIPIKEHDIKTDEILHGKVVDIKRRFKKNPVPHYTIDATILLDKEYYELYNEDKLPGASVEIDPKGANLMCYTGEDTHVGEYIYAVALCGKTPVAMPQLVQDTDAPPLYNMYSLQTRLLNDTRFDKNIIDENKNKEYTPMPKIEQLAEAISLAIAPAITEVLNKAFPANTEEKVEDPELTEKPEMAAAKKKEEDEMAADADPDEFGQDKEARLVAAEKELKELKGDSIESAFQKIVDKGFIPKESREKVKKQFTKIAETQGVTPAVEVFSTLAVAPPQGEIIKGDDDKAVLTADEKAHKEKIEQYGKTFNFDGDETWKRIQKKKEDEAAAKAV